MIATKVEDILETTMELKLLDFSLDKCSYIDMGLKLAMKTIEHHLKANPLTLCNLLMKVSPCETYLGDMLSEKALGDSVHTTLTNRRGHIFNTIAKDNLSCSITIINFVFTIENDKFCMHYCS